MLYASVYPYHNIMSFFFILELNVREKLLKMHSMLYKCEINIFFKKPHILNGKIGT